jgi:fluoroquinolone transport system permease protein
MRRILATAGLDARLQFRNGFYYAALFVVALLGILITQVPRLDWGYLLPVLAQSGLALSTFYFIGGLALLEKGEGTLEAQVVSPLRPREYLLSKLATLAGLAVVENLTLVIIAVGPNFNPTWWLAGTMAGAFIYSLFGFIAVARYDSINEYLFPSLLFTTALSMPFIDYFGVLSHTVFYLHPIQPVLILLRAAFTPVPDYLLVYALVAATLWTAFLYWWAIRTFRRFVTQKAGVR